MNIEKIGAGIVTFNPELERFERVLAAVCDQVEKIWIVDNHSTNIEGIKTIIHKYPNVVLTVNKQNIGIATALNQIFRMADNENYSWILTLDDDSICGMDLVRKLYFFTKRKRVGIVCAKVTDDAMEDRVKRKEKKVKLVEDCITAGALTSVTAWKTVGGFDDVMFIDFVDIEFCERLRQGGYRIIRNSEVCVNQQYGSITGKIRVLGVTLYIFNYAPERIYYSVRNQIYFIRKHRNNIRVMQRGFFLTGFCGKHLLFEKNRINTIKAIAEGLVDGFKMQI